MSYVFHVDIELLAKAVEKALEQQSAAVNGLKQSEPLKKTLESLSRNLPSLDLKASGLVEAYERAVSSAVISDSALLRAKDALVRAIPVSRMNQILEAVRSAENYMSETQKEEIGDIVQTVQPDPVQPEKPRKGWISVGQLFTLLNLILSLIAIVISRLPDEQLDELARQNEALIEQQAEELRLLRQLSEAAGSINDILDSVQDETQPTEKLGEDILFLMDGTTQFADDPDDPEDTDLQSDNADPLEQDNAEDQK